MRAREEKKKAFLIARAIHCNVFVRATLEDILRTIAWNE